MPNFDGIVKTKYQKKVLSPVVKVKHIMPVDGVFRVANTEKPVQKEVFYTGFFVPPKNYSTEKVETSFIVIVKRYISNALGIFDKQWDLAIAGLKKFNLSGRAVPVYALVVVLTVGFGVGVWATLSTQKSEAQNITQTQAGFVPMNSAGNLGPISDVSNDVLFNMTIGQLENYLNSLAEQNRALKAAEIMAIRKERLHTYLKNKNTPFAEVSDIIAEQKHWKLILAISFAESTFGRNCVDNNCSNIGVKPGHDYWRKYASLGDWVKDFNKLLERRYSDWTLEEMNGVYVQPKNPNWLVATRQILEELQEQGIE